MASNRPKYVFSYSGERQKKMNNSGWQGARKKAGSSQVRVHDIKHNSEFRIMWPISILDRKGLEVASCECYDATSVIMSSYFRDTASV